VFDPFSDKAAMPKILNYTPPWLSRPSPGSKIFSDPRGHVSQTSTSHRTSQLGSPNGVKQGESYQGPRRLLANRGTEIFTVVDNKIRWADLAHIKSEWDEQAGAREAHGSAGPTQRQNGASAPYRVGCISQHVGLLTTFTDSFRLLLFQSIRKYDNWSSHLRTSSSPSLLSIPSISPFSLTQVA
jgi:hypothetical protein